MKKTLLAFLLSGCLLMFCSVALSTTTTSNSTHARNSLSKPVKRSLYIPFYNGKFDRDGYVAALMANDVYEDTVQYVVFNNAPEYNRFGRVANGNYVFNSYVSETEKKLIFSFRGTKMSSLDDWSENFDAFYTKIILSYSPYVEFNVHSGFYDEIMSYQSELFRIVDSFPNYAIIWTGHSQGGGLAQIAAALIGYRKNIAYSRAITFGSTAAGDQKFANFALALVKHDRIVNADPCTFLSCIDVDPVSEILPSPYVHFGNFYPLQTDYILLGKHSMDRYVKQVLLRLNIYDSIVFKMFPSTVVFQQQSRVYYEVNQCTAQSLVFRLTKDGNNWPYTLFTCNQFGYFDISNLQSGVYTMAANLGGNTISTYPKQLTIVAPSFECPSTCNSCDSSKKQCTSCSNGYYGPLCQYYCNPNCLSCNSSTTCNVCKNSNTILPNCVAKCNGCSNGQCIEGKCVCNSGYGGVNCTSIICPENCLTCSSPYLCTSCLPRTFGATCSFTCIPNCLTCLDDKTCTKCDAGYSGTTCSVGPNYFSTVMSTFLGGTISDLPTIPFKTRKLVTLSNNYYFGIGNKFNVFYRLLVNTAASNSFSVIYDNAIYSPFTGISSIADSSIVTTSVPGYILVYGSHISVPSSATPPLFNTRINETFIGVQQTTFFSFFLSSSGNIRVFGDSSTAGSACSASGFYGVYKISNFTKLDIPVSISYLSCPGDSLCFAYSRETRRLFGWGSVLYDYYEGAAICQYTPLELDTSSFGTEIIMSISGWGPFFFITESGKVFYTGSNNFLVRPSKPTLLSTSFIGTNERIIKVTVTYSSVIFTTYSMKNFVVGNFYKISNGATTASTTGKLWPSDWLVTNYVLYSPISCNGTFDFDPAVCNGNGACEEINMCYCKPGYSGTYCDTPICYGKRSDVASVCSGVGSCLSPNNCSCPQGYSGLNCEITSLPSNNCLSSDCKSCKTGYYDTASYCKSRCMLNCEICSSGETCDKCVGGMTGAFCNEKQCQASNCITCSTVTGLCLECKEGLFGSACNSTCPFNCKSCTSLDTCSSCNQGWFGQRCENLHCQDNCLQCTSPTQCIKCVDGYFGADCSNSCLSTCGTCTNSTSCLTCPPFTSGPKCDVVAENCFSFNSVPTVSVSNPSSSLLYTISIPKMLENSVNSTRFSLSNILTCDGSTLNSTELVVNSTRKLLCETEYVIATSIPDLLKDSRVIQQLDASGVVLTLTVPIYIGMVSNLYGYCQITNYQVNHQIKLLLSSHQYINMGVLNANSTLQLSYRREVIAVVNKKLNILGTLFSENSNVESVSFAQSDPIHNVSFDISVKFSSSGVYSLSILAREVLSYFSGVFSFNVYLRSSSGELFQVPLLISLSYYMPIDPPSTEFKLFSQLNLYSDNFKEIKNSFKISEKPHIVVKVVDSEGKSSTLQSTVRISIKNAYMCCVKSGDSMPTFDLQNGQYGCTQYNPSLMLNWFHLIRNQTEVSQYESSAIKFPFVNNQIAFNFRLTSKMFSNTTYGSISNCFIHTETILTNDGQTARSSKSTKTASTEQSYNSFDIIQIVNNQQPTDTSTPAIASQKLNSSEPISLSLLVLILLSILQLIR